MPTKTQLEEQLTAAKEEIAGLTAKLSSAISTPIKEKKPKVKRAPGAYAQFVKAEFAGLKKENPDATAPEVMKLISIKWKEMKAAKEAKAKA